MSETKKTTAQKQMDRAEDKARDKAIIAVGEWIAVRKAQNAINLAPDGDKHIAAAVALLNSLRPVTT